MNKKEIIDYFKSYAQPPQMMKVFPDCEIIKMAITMLEQQDSLPKNLEKAALRYAIPAYMKDVDENYLHEYPYDPIKEKAFIDGAKWKEQQMLKEAVEFECIGKKVKMTIQELINYYIDQECCDVADECGF